MASRPVHGPLIYPPSVCSVENEPLERDSSKFPLSSVVDLSSLGWEGLLFMHHRGPVS
jgi:hypothetical protein